MSQLTEFFSLLNGSGVELSDDAPHKVLIQQCAASQRAAVTL